MMTDPDFVEQDRLERALKRHPGYRGRTMPACLLPALARTSAFAPRSRNLNRTAGSTRLYEIPNVNVVKVTGPELGIQHRMLLTALLRHHVNIIDLAGRSMIAVVSVTWRDLLKSMNKGAHPNNIDTYFNALRDLDTAQISVWRGSWTQYQAQLWGYETDKNADFSAPLITSARCTGLTPNDEIRVHFGPDAARDFKEGNLVSVDADVFFRLRSDYAKSLWPVIDGHKKFFFLHESTIASYVGLDLRRTGWREWQTFRRSTKRAFEAMKAAGGLEDWYVEEGKQGRIGKREQHKYVFTRPLSPGSTPLRGVAPEGRHEGAALAPPA
ncbi:hypothetical protein [Caenispirillum salinarum]|uniref:hypothetical protein n=1 Tax=Caenispirillum salinarum TaxID=859058 RepID=UPI00384B136C